MPDGHDFGDMMRQLDEEERATREAQLLAIDADALAAMHAAQVERRAALEAVARQLADEAGVPVHAHRGRIWIRVRDEHTVRRLQHIGSKDLRRAILRAGDVEVYGIEPGEEWKWVPDAVATARLFAHERRVQPRIQHRLTEFVVRRTRARRDALRGGAA